eukprot:gnl/MRDRNA2_/MRDRNA2_62273_c0_seq1.p1 gnl/MRDRNA2_/MRDRNA2_62273_c0~~gnl/MRDRNA2_/MRDRNA2_62273_c0_seq1.p1  ORF type:complete len:723 (-),score=201.87 gnl/MRDRNA2_/MRDRNA2_62273_c0_seq1:248-2416(-)
MSTVSYSGLLQKCIKVIKTYEPKKTTVDAHCDDSPVLKDKNLGAVERKFIIQTFYGCDRYQKLLKVFVTSFLHKYSTVAQRSDQTLYMILSYILFFRLQELGVPEFKRLYNCGLGTPPALHALLLFAFNEEDLNNWVTMEWCKLYDARYIEESVIGRLQTFKSEMLPLIDSLEYKATGTGNLMQDVQKEKNVTKFEPFDLTQAKPRVVPEPEVINTEIKALPVPSTIHSTSLEAVEEEKRQRLEDERRRVQAKYSEELLFNLETDKRPATREMEELRMEVDNLRHQECTFKPVVKVYRPPEQIAEVQQTVSSVLREDAMIKKKQEMEYRILKDYEEGLRDASAYNEWQQDMREQDELDEELRVQQRKVETQMAREMAIEAREAVVRQNQIMAEHQKDQMQAARSSQDHDQHQQLLKKQQLVHDVGDERLRAREAEENLFHCNKKRADDMRLEKDVDKERKKHEDACQMEQRKDLIRQIRSVERVPVQCHTSFDPSEPPQQGFMEEMPLSELRERLQRIKAQQAKELEDKRHLNLEKKHQKQTELMEKANNLSKVRGQAKAYAQERQNQIRARQAEVEQQKEMHREKCIVETSENIEARMMQKRQEEARLRQELKEVAIKRQFLQANAAMVEAKAHGEQQHGLQREAKVRQNNLLLEQNQRNKVKSTERIMRQASKQQELDTMRTMRMEVDQRLAQGKADDSALKEEIRTSNLMAKTRQINSR